MVSSIARSASLVRPSATNDRTRGAIACTIPNRSPSSRNACSARRDNSSASLNRPDHSRIEASSESIIAGAQVSPSSSDSGAHRSRQQLRIGEPALEEADVARAGRSPSRAPTPSPSCSNSCRLP